MRCRITDDVTYDPEYSFSKDRRRNTDDLEEWKNSEEYFNLKFGEDKNEQ